MSADKFFTVEIVDKFSRMFMLLFAGIVLGTVLALAYYNIFRSEIIETLALIIVYCVLFFLYVSFANSKRNITKVEILKDYLSFVFEKKNEISSKINVGYQEIEQYKISPLTDRKNLNKSEPDKSKYSLRVFGFKTEVKLRNGDKIEFQDSYSDGVLIYSPSYVYRMLDLKRFRPDFPLVLENFAAPKDAEDFDLQFRYYAENAKNLPLIKNKRYFCCLFKYALIFIVIAFLIASFIAYAFYTGLKDKTGAVTLLYFALGLLFSIIVPMYAGAFLTSSIGSLFNEKARNTIKNIIQG